MITASAARLARIPLVDIRGDGPVRHAIEGRERARALRDECIAWLPRVAAGVLPVMDSVTRRWLLRSRSPYAAEVDAIAAEFGFPGIWFLNGCYQWGCTALACEQAGAPWLVRTLDWPFPGLGRHLEVARMRGAVGDFDNVTWPGYVGVLTASAPGRFAACINQAPMWRRSRRPWLRPYDIALNAMQTWGIRSIPPDHLLREVFETCKTFGEAKRRLETTPIARPVIYSLVGCCPGERCVIERTEEDFASRGRDTIAANDWLRSRPPWEARIAPRFFIRAPSMRRPRTVACDAITLRLGPVLLSGILNGCRRRYSTRRPGSRSRCVLRAACSGRSATNRPKARNCPRP